MANYVTQTMKIPVEKFNAYKTADKIKVIATTFLAVVAMAGSLFAGYNHFQTDEEGAAAIEAFKQKTDIAHGLLSNKVSKQAEIHQRDEDAHDRALKNSRLDRVDARIEKIDEELLFNSYTAEQKEYKRNLRRDLEDKRKCINEDKC